MAGRPHGWLLEFCTRLERVIVGRAASTLLEHLPADRARRGLIVLPSWMWLRPSADVGRKSAARDGGELLLPVRVAWDGGPVRVLAAGEEASVTWSGIGAGWSGRGATAATVRSVPVSPTAPARWVTSAPVAVAASPEPKRALVAHLARLGADGRSAVWEALSALEPYANRAVWRAHAAVRAELSGDPGAAADILDAIEIQQVVDKLLVGDDDDGPSPVARLLERCLRPDAFRGADPLRVVSASLRRDAEIEIRRRIGDPHIGPKIRSVAMSLGIADARADLNPERLAELLALYRSARPRDRLGETRARRAVELIGGPPPPAIPVPSPEAISSLSGRRHRRHPV